MEQIKKLNENDVYWIAEDKAIMIHLSNNPTGQRNQEGQLIDNIKNEGWFLYKGKPGQMKPITKLGEFEAIKIINEVRK
jgi:hypothetical protein